MAHTLWLFVPYWGCNKWLIYVSFIANLRNEEYIKVWLWNVISPQSAAAFMAMRERHADILKKKMRVFVSYSQLIWKKIAMRTSYVRMFLRSIVKGDLCWRIMAKNDVMVRQNPVTDYKVVTL